MLEPLPIDGKYFAILSNPPYIDEEVYLGLEKELFHEPKIALVAEGRGAIFYERLVPLGLSLLKDGGFLAFEIGYDQGDLLRTLAEDNGATATIIKDYGGNERVAIIKKA